MNLCLRFVTSTVMGLDLAAILLAAILALPTAYADEDPVNEEGGDDGTTIDLVFDCTLKCDCINVNGTRPCRVVTEPKCGTQCFCTGVDDNRKCYNQ